MIIDKIGLGNLISFISAYIATEFDWIQFVESWTQIMFAISATGAATYSVCKVIGWFRKNNKNKK